MRTIASSSSNYLLKGFSEQEIIALQDVFLINGMHDITVTDIKQGRSMINAFITALNYHKTIACLTTEQLPLELEIFDIYKMLQESGPITSPKLFEFFLEQFSFDLLVIETSKKLLQTSWFEDFQQQMIDFKFDMSIPIISLSYSHTTI